MNADPNPYPDKSRRSSAFIQNEYFGKISHELILNEGRRTKTRKSFMSRCFVWDRVRIRDSIHKQWRQAKIVKSVFVFVVLLKLSIVTYITTKLYSQSDIISGRVNWTPTVLQYSRYISIFLKYQIFENGFLKVLCVHPEKISIYCCGHYPLKDLLTTKIKKVMFTSIFHTTPFYSRLIM
jgi:hypothetical protein